LRAFEAFLRGLTRHPGKSECPFAAQCYSEAAKEKARNADVVITNTAMLMTDLVVRKATQGYGSLLGTYEAVIIDEAHEVEEWATNALSGGLNPKGLTRLASEAQTFASNQGTNISEYSAEVERATKAVWTLLSLAGATEREPKRLTRSWFLENSEPFAVLIESLKALANEVEGVTVQRGDEKKQKSRQALLVTRAYNAASRVESVLFDGDDETVRWTEIERNARFGDTTHLKVSPIHVGAFLEETLWSQVPVALISATLSVGGSFKYISDRLGLANPSTINVGTPFDYQTQARLFLPGAKMPSPKERGAWQAYANATTLDLVRKAGGGALLLFTSRSAMRDAYAALSYEFEQYGITTLMQGQDGSNKEIAERFKADEHSVLFALKSFMTGFDAAGDTCRLVVIDKLAFPVPTEPVFAARAQQVKARGGSDFSDLSIPSMTLTMVQAFGRLIRSKKDRGVVAILDSRLTSTAWGQKIVKTLPDAPVIMSTDEAAAFYGEG
jgi:ATP-dependent DNA helicase DinG